MRSEDIRASDLREGDVLASGAEAPNGSGAPEPADEPPAPVEPPAPEPPPPAAARVDDAEVDAAYLERRLLAVLGREPHTIADVAVAIDAPPGHVKAAVTRLCRAGEVSRLPDERYCA